MFWLPRKKKAAHPTPFDERWSYFLAHLAAVPATISLVESVPDDKLCDIEFLENELIPLIGLNDENLHEHRENLTSISAREFTFSNIPINLRAILPGWLIMRLEFILTLKWDHAGAGLLF